MIRYFLAKGDRAGSATIVEALDNVTCSNPPPRVQIATLGMATYCMACKQTGSIAPKGPRRPGTAPNGKPWALSGDINLCGCRPSPVFYAQRNMMVSFTAQEVAKWMGEGGTSRERTSLNAATQGYDEQVQLMDRMSGQPLVNFPYRFRGEDGTLIEGRTDIDGYTLRVKTAVALDLDLEHTIGEGDGWE